MSPATKPGAAFIGRNPLPDVANRAASRMPNATQRLLRGAEMRKLVNIPRVSFESMMRKRARASLGRLRNPQSI